MKISWKICYHIVSNTNFIWFRFCKEFCSEFYKWCKGLFSKLTSEKRLGFHNYLRYYPCTGSCVIHSISCCTSPWIVSTIGNKLTKPGVQKFLIIKSLPEAVLLRKWLLYLNSFRRSFRTRNIAKCQQSVY